MILRHRDWDSEKELEKPMTVGKFIEEIVLKDKNKERKYFKISIKEEISGKSNLIIYYQNNEIKSHHSTGIEFNYNEIVDLEIRPYYYERVTRVEDIISMNLDFEPEKNNKATTLSKEKMDKITKELLIKWEREELERNNRKKVFYDNINQEDLIICVRQLLEDLEKQKLMHYDLLYKINRCKEKEKNLQQQIKWLEYRLNNKL